MLIEPSRSTRRKPHVAMQKETEKPVIDYLTGLSQVGTPHAAHHIWDGRCLRGHSDAFNLPKLKHHLPVPGLQRNRKINNQNPYVIYVTPIETPTTILPNTKDRERRIMLLLLFSR